MASTAEPPLDLAALAAIPVTRLHGVGERKAKALAESEIQTLLDLITYYPRRYIDRTNQAQIAELMAGDEASVLVTVERCTARRVKGGRVLVNAMVGDGSGRMQLVFFNQAWRERQLISGLEAVVYGKMELFRGQRQMTNPVVDLVGNQTGRIVPVYAQSEKSGIYTSEVAGWVAEALRRTLKANQGRGLADPVPAGFLRRHDLIEREEALRLIHQPDSMGDVTRARRRLVFDELLRMQLALVLRKRAIERTSKGLVHVTDGPLVTQLHAKLPFPLTGAQHRAIDEIAADLRRPVPMHRLLQGDVGAGKTLVAVATMLAAIDGGHQAALMAPTEVLAEQHWLGIRALLDGSDGGVEGVAVRRAAAAGGAADQPAHGGRTAPGAGRPAGRRDRHRRRHPRPDPGGRGVRVAGRGRDRRAAPLRGGAAGGAAGAEPGRGPARRAGHDGHPHSPHGGHDRLRRPRRVGPRRAAPGSDPDRHPLGAGLGHAGRAAGGSGVGCRPGVDVGRDPGPDRRGAPGLRGVPPDRPVGEAGGGVGRGDVRPAPGRRARRVPHGPAPRPSHAGREGSDDGAVPLGAASTCWWPRP